MKFIVFLTTLFVVTGAFAGEGQELLKVFFENNKPFGSYVYCRDNSGAPECRTVTLFADKDSGFPVDGFQISFFAPVRPQAATEVFLPSSNVKDSSGDYYKFVDNTMNGTFTVAESGMQQVIFSQSDDTVTIKGLPFGDLIFGDEDSRVVLKDGTNIIYPIVD